MQHACADVDGLAETIVGSKQTLLYTCIQDVHCIYVNMAFRGPRARIRRTKREARARHMIPDACAGVLLAPLLTLPEAAPLGVDAAQAASAAADAHAASPDALSTGAAAHGGRVCGSQVRQHAGKHSRSMPHAITPYQCGQADHHVACDACLMRLDNLLTPDYKWSAT